MDSASRCQRLCTVSPVTPSPTHPLHSIHHHGDGTRQKSVIGGKCSSEWRGVCEGLWVRVSFQSELATPTNEWLSVSLSPAPTNEWLSVSLSPAQRWRPLDRQLSQLQKEGIKESPKLYIQIPY